MAIEKPTWIYKSEGDKQTASEMNQLAQAVITNATELSNAKDDVANLSDDVASFDGRLTAIEESETEKKEEKNQPWGYAGLDYNGKIPIEKTYGTTATVVDVETYESLPITGLSGVIYYILNTSAQYKWSGSAYIDITDGEDKAKKNETAIFDCSNGTSTKYYSSLSNAINAVPPVYRTSNRIISYLSTENSTTSAANYQFHGIDSTTWTDLTKWERIPNQTDLADIRSDLSEIEINKLDKSSLSSSLNLDSENNAATSRAVKFLNDKVEQVKDGGLEDGSIELPKLSPTLAAYIGSGGEVTNQADDEDLENAIINDVPVIREKTTKTYNPENYSGMGRVILRKNMVNGVNVLTQEMINQANTIYEIRYDFDLNGAEITIPEGCTLNFVGGSISNGVLNLNNCGTNGTKENFHNISIIGACNLNKHGYKIASVIGMVPNSKENAINNGEILKKLIELRLSLFLDGTYYISMGNSIYDLDYEFCLEGGKLIIEEKGMQLRLLENASFLLKNTNIESTSYCAIIQNLKTSWKIDRVEIHNTMLKNVRIILHFEDIDPEKNSIGIRKFIIKNSTIKCSPYPFSIKDALFENEMQICNNYFYDIDYIGFVASTTNGSLYSLTKGEMSVPVYIKNNIFRGINSENEEHYAVQVETKEVHFLNNTVLNMASTKETCTVSDSYINANILYFIGNICTNILGVSKNNSILCFTKSIFNKDKYSLKFISNNLWTVDEKYLNEIGLLNKSNIIFNFVSKIDTVIFTNNKILYPNREYGISFKLSEIEVENFHFTNNTIDNVKFFPKVISNAKVIITDNFFNSGDSPEYEEVKIVSTTGCNVIFDNTLSENIGLNLQGPKIIAKVNMSNTNFAYNVPTVPCELINSDINVRTSRLSYYLANLLNTKFNVKSLNSPITLNFFLIEDSAGKYYRLKFNNVIADIKLMDDSFQLMLNRKSLTQVLYEKYTKLLNTSTTLYIYKKTVSGKNFIIIQLTEPNYANFSLNFCDIPESAFTLDCNPSTGTNNERPVLTATNIGFQYYDTSLKKYIVWNGTAWVNMDGTALS